VIDTRRRHYNHVRPHESLNDLTPIEFKTATIPPNRAPFSSYDWSKNPWAGHTS
jgi:hypothetical protein